MSYSAPERETIIRSDDEGKTWSIYTLQQPIITKLRKVGVEPYQVDKDGAHHYKGLKSNQVSFRSGKEREYSEEQKEQQRERAKNMHKSKKGENE